MKKLLREELTETRKELKEAGDWKEDFKKLMEEVKEEMKGGIKKTGGDIEKWVK